MAKRFHAGPVPERCFFLGGCVEGSPGRLVQEAEGQGVVAGVPAGAVGDDPLVSGAVDGEFLVLVGSPGLFQHCARVVVAVFHVLDEQGQQRLALAGPLGGALIDVMYCLAVDSLMPICMAMNRLLLPSAKRLITSA